MPALDTKYTTMFSLDTVKGYLDVSLTDASKDTLIAQIADGVSEKFEAKTGRRIVTRTGETETWSGDGSRARFLRFMDVRQIVSLTIDGVAVALDTIALDGRLGLLQLRDTAAARFGVGVANCVAVFDVGLGDQDDDDLPSDVIEACLEWVKAIYDERITGATGGTSVSLGGATFMLKPTLGYQIRETVAAWTDVRR